VSSGAGYFLFTTLTPQVVKLSLPFTSIAATVQAASSATVRP
jgi:hypothetical protein